MSDLAVQEDRSPRRRLHDEITSEQQLAEFQAALPENVSVDRFRRALSTAINEKPELIDVYVENPRSLFSALSKCASAGLLPDGKQAAINVYNTKQKQPDGSEKWVKTAQFLPMKDGLRWVLAQYGWTLTSRVVYTNDDFDWTEEPPTLSHKAARGDRGEREYVWTKAVHRDGRYIQRVLDKARVMQSKKKAKTTKIWDEWEDAMWEKTGDHAIFDDVPLDETERDRIKAILAAGGLLADPVAALYGEPERPALAAAKDPSGDPSDGKTPQAAPQPTPAAGDAAPGPDQDDEGDFWPGDDEPEQEAELTEAEKAGAVTLPANAKPERWAGLRIDAIAQTEAGQAFLVKCLDKLPVENEHRAAIAAYAVEVLPAMWETYQAKAAA